RTSTRLKGNSYSQKPVCLRLIEEVLAKASVIMDLTPELFANSIDDYSRDLRPAEWGSGAQFAQQQSETAHVRFVPKADISRITRSSWQVSLNSIAPILLR